VLLFSKILRTGIVTEPLETGETVVTLGRQLDTRVQRLLGRTPASSTRG
jgi:hypothetical protein